MALYIKVERGFTFSIKRTLSKAAVFESVCIHWSRGPLCFVRGGGGGLVPQPPLGRLETHPEALGSFWLFSQKTMWGGGGDCGMPGIQPGEPCMSKAMPLFPLAPYYPF